MSLRDLLSASLATTPPQADQLLSNAADIINDLTSDDDWLFVGKRLGMVLRLIDLARTSIRKGE